MMEDLLMLGYTAMTIMTCHFDCLSFYFKCRRLSTNLLPRTTSTYYAIPLMNMQIDEYPTK